MNPFLAGINRALAVPRSPRRTIVEKLDRLLRAANAKRIAAGFEPHQVNVVISPERGD